MTIKTFTQLAFGLAVGALAVMTLGACSDSSFTPTDKANAGAGGQGAAAGAAGQGGTAGSAGQGGAADSAGVAGSAAGSAGAGSADAGADADATAGGAADGASCTDEKQCLSGNCVDGVCCITACGEECESCALPGTEGSCTPQASGTDPDQECGAYLCGPAGCKKACAADKDCSSTGFYCDLPTQKCQIKKANGQACAVNGACSSGNCVSGICCNSACGGANFSCSTGTCSCGGKVCGATETCVDWYRDSDGDTYGDAKLKQLGCSATGTALPGYVNNSKDCYDKNADAKPGQTKYFPVHRGDGKFDYDCNGADQQERGNSTGAMSCGLCQTLPSCSPTKPAFCPTAPICVYWPSEGWKGVGPALCGDSADYTYCALNINNLPQETTFKQTQSCR